MDSLSSSQLPISSSSSSTTALKSQYHHHHQQPLSTPKIIIIIFIEEINRSSTSSIRMAADVKIRKTPTTKARTLDNLLEDGAVHIRK
ncbi:hypothetical protein Hanom_Chr07g00646201 [Helianthus anomalus]